MLDNFKILAKETTCYRQIRRRNTQGLFLSHKLKVIPKKGIHGGTTVTTHQRQALLQGN